MKLTEWQKNHVRECPDKESGKLLADSFKTFNWQKSKSVFILRGKRVSATTEDRIRYGQEKLTRCFHGIRQRCGNPNSQAYKYYGARGIKCLITYGELYQLWERDKGWMLKKPSIDRIDNDGNYAKENCRFIEQSENSRRSHTPKKPA